MTWGKKGQVTDVKIGVMCYAGVQAAHQGRIRDREPLGTALRAGGLVKWGERQLMASDRAIRVMIVDDHADARSGIRYALLAFDDLQLVAEAKNCQEALAACDRLRDTEALPDVILMDMLMPETDGVATTQALLDRHPEVRVIALASFDTEMLVKDALRAGAIGYLPKDATIDELAEAVRAAHAGRVPAACAAAGARLKAHSEPGRELTDR